MSTATPPVSWRERVALAGTFLALAVRYWLTVYPHVVVHIRRTRVRAQAIADPALRGLALESLAKRSNLEGAAAFAALTPRATRRPALQALLAFQSLYNHADVLAEQAAAVSLAHVRLAHLPLTCVFADSRLGEDPGAAGSWAGDDRYVGELVERCRLALASLPSAALVRDAALRSAGRIAEFQAHSRPAATPAELELWARALPPRAPGMSWWETAAACGSSLSVHALIAAAGTPRLDPTTVARLEHAYGAQVGALHSLLDSLIDQDDDALIGQPSLIALYPSARAATVAMGELARDAVAAAHALPHARRHAVIVAAMASLYLSAPQARTPRAEPVARAVRAGIGRLAIPAMAVFALRRAGILRAMSRVRAPARTNAARAEPEQPASVCARGA